MAKDLKNVVLDVNNLHVSFDTYAGEVKAVRGVTFTLHEGEVLAMDTPQRIFRNKEIVDKAWLAVPQVSMVAVELEQSGIPLDAFPVRLEEGVEVFSALLQETEARI